MESNTPGEIIRLFLEKLESLTEEERKILIKQIYLMSSPVFSISNSEKITRII